MATTPCCLGQAFLALLAVTACWTGDVCMQPLQALVVQSNTKQWRCAGVVLPRRCLHCKTAAQTSLQS
jgi:hypothetical protein